MRIVGLVAPSVRMLPVSVQGASQDKLAELQIDSGGKLNQLATSVQCFTQKLKYIEKVLARRVDGLQHESGLMQERIQALSMVNQEGCAS